MISKRILKKNWKICKKDKWCGYTDYGTNNSWIFYFNVKYCSINFTTKFFATHRMIFFCFLCLSIFSSNFAQQNASSPLSIKIGLLMPSDPTAIASYSQSAGAVILALDQVISDQLLPANTNFRLFLKKWILKNFSSVLVNTSERFLKQIIREKYLTFS